MAIYVALDLHHSLDRVAVDGSVDVREQRVGGDAGGRRWGGGLSADHGVELVLVNE